MPNTPRSSFIPKQVTNTTPNRVQKRRVFSIVNIFATIFLIASVSLAGGIFFYKTYLGKDLQNQKNTLEEQRARFSETHIATVQNFDKQVKTAKALLDKHISPTIIFDALEATTQQSVQYTSFALERRPSGGVTITLDGVTDEFAKVVLQSTALKGKIVLSQTELTKLTLGEEGGDEEGSSAKKAISFGIISNINADDIKFNPVEEMDSVDDTDVEDTATTTDDAGIEETTAITATSTSAVDTE